MKIRLFKLFITLIFLYIILQQFYAIAGYETCPKCNGDGICKFCYGTRTLINCPDCDLSGRVYVEDCTICNGSGYIDGYECSMCSGTGEIWETCSNCEGTGYIFAPADLDCEYCAGLGLCSFCGGDGQVFKPPKDETIFNRDMTPGFEGGIFVFVVIIALVLIHFRKKSECS